MIRRLRISATAMMAVACALVGASHLVATGVPISGFSPFMGLSLTDQFKDENDATFFLADNETSLVGTQFGVGGTPYYDVALLDTGAAASLITDAADASFNIQGAGFRGTHTQTLTGVGDVEAIINDPMAMFVTGLANRTSTAPLAFNNSTMVGQSSVSILTLPAGSELPNVVGIPLLITFATYIRNDQPQIFQVNGKSVRSPQIQLLPRGSGGQGIVRQAQLTLNQPDGFSSQAPPLYIYDFANFSNGMPLTQNPTSPTVMEAPGALFLNVDVNNVDNSGIAHTLPTKQFLLDTGADVTVLSVQNAAALGIDPLLIPSDFTVSVIGAGGATDNVPGYFVDHLTIPAAGGDITVDNVPVLVLNLPNPGDPNNVVDGVIGTNILSGRNLVIDPNPAAEPGGDPNLYISDPVTTGHNWASASASGNWATSGNWSAAGIPNTLWIANARNVSGSAQEAVVSADSTVWELNVSGVGANTMTVRLQNGVRLTTFSGVNIESAGRVRLQNATLDAQYVDIRGGTLTGSGMIVTGSGPIAGQVENHGGIVAPGDGVGTLNISGRFENATDGTLEMELGGTTAGTQYDQLIVDGSVGLAGTLSISLVDLGGGTFVPSVGNTFTLVTATGGLGGSFDHLLAPDGLNWLLNYTTNSVQLVVGNPGDFNNDGAVDAGDYVVWRKDGGGPQNYLAWRSHFGMTYGGGSAASVSASIPEPASVILIVLAACIFALRPGRLLGPLGPQRR
jgi:hypothetical protein